MMATPISVEDSWRNEAMKGNKQQADNKLNECIDECDKIHNWNNQAKMEIERKDTKLKVIKPTENMDTECKDRPPQSKAYKTMDK